MTADELQYALTELIAWVGFAFFLTALAVGLRVTWTRM